MIRRRLALGVAAVTVLTVIVGGWAVLRTLEVRLVDDLDREFRRGDLLEQLRGSVGGARPFEPRPAPPLDPVQRFAVLRLDPDGRIEASSPSGPVDDPDALPDITGLEPGAGIQTVDAVEGSLRYRATALRLRDGASAVVALPMTSVDETMADTRRILLVTGIALTGAIAGLSYVVIRRAFAPVDTMIATADRIAAGDLTERTGVVDDGTEVGRLGGALDTMLDRIEGAVAAKTASEERMRLFVAEASHELRTPLTSVRGYAELYRQGADDPAAVATSMARIEEEATRMTRLVEQLLVLARLDRSPEASPVTVDVGRVVGEAVDAARVVDGARTYDLDLPSTAAVVTGDADQLRRVVDNLLTNARVHTPAGTAVHVRLAVADDGVELTVHDNGPGIAVEDRDRVFDRFWRSTRADQNPVAGTGLGLAIVRSIVEAHGGRISVDDSPAGGTCFTVWLPHPSPDPSCSDSAASFRGGGVTGGGPSTTAAAPGP